MFKLVRAGTPYSYEDSLALTSARRHVRISLLGYPLDLFKSPGLSANGRLSFDWNVFLLGMSIDNIARNGIASQISNHRTNRSNTASNAIDGNFKYDCCAVTRKIGGAWWQVDLQTQFRIVAVSITTWKMAGMTTLSYYKDSTWCRKLPRTLVAMIGKQMLTSKLHCSAGNNIVKFKFSMDLYCRTLLNRCWKRHLQHGKSVLFTGERI